MIDLDILDQYDIKDNNIRQEIKIGSETDERFRPEDDFRHNDVEIFFRDKDGENKLKYNKESRGWLGNKFS